LRIQSDVPSKAPMKSTANKVRVMSRRVSVMESPFRLAFASSPAEKEKQNTGAGPLPATTDARPCPSKRGTTQSALL
jgi:hypothetical protein